MPSSVIEVWDARLQLLWGERLSDALRTAEALFASDTDQEPMIQEGLEARLAAMFWRQLTRQCHRMPETPFARYDAVLATLNLMLWTIRQSVTVPFVEEYVAVTLRPVRRLRAGALTEEVCAALIDFHRGVWTPHLTKPQLHILQVALAKTIADLPPDEMTEFWERLHSEDASIRRAMLLGLEFLRSAHAVPHLLHGLNTCPDHATRSAILNCLEEVADPRAIAPLTELRRETALSDWTLSRHIARVLRVIEQQNRGLSHRTLLRPSQTPSNEETSLLRPAADAEEIRRKRNETENARLLRPVEPSDDEPRA